MGDNTEYQTPMDQCEHCCNGKINIDGDFRAYVYPEVIQPILEEEGIINNLEDLQDLLTNIAIGQIGSGEIKCPVCD